MFNENLNLNISFLSYFVSLLVALILFNNYFMITCRKGSGNTTVMWCYHKVQPAGKNTHSLATLLGTSLLYRR